MSQVRILPRAHTSESGNPRRPANSPDRRGFLLSGPWPGAPAVPAAGVIAPPPSSSDARTSPSTSTRPRRPAPPATYRPPRAARRPGERLLSGGGQARARCSPDGRHQAPPANASPPGEEPYFSTRAQRLRQPPATTWRDSSAAARDSSCRPARRLLATGPANNHGRSGFVQVKLPSFVPDTARFPSPTTVLTDWSSAVTARPVAADGWDVSAGAAPGLDELGA